ncbi:MAG: PE family protein [Segniliparus sp.]|uniref:PE family protein n=1 Tax=Segniliparus sp. TaxID=2804064 RepID=UPI003F3691A5
MFVNVEPEAISAAAATLEGLSMKLQAMVAAASPSLQMIPPAGFEDVSVFASAQHMFNSDNFLMMAEQSILELQRLIIALNEHSMQYTAQDAGNAAVFGV